MLDERSKRSSCLRAVAFIVIRKIIKDYKLEEILGMYFKERDLGLFLDLAVYSIITEDNNRFSESKKVRTGGPDLIPFSCPGLLFYC